MRGLATALVEHADFASGTSSRSSKLIHGGFRYLEHGEVRLVLEGVRERGRLRRLAPHLVQPQEFVLPVYACALVGLLKLAAGLWAYALPAGLRNVQRHRMLSARATRAAERALRTAGLRGAGRYWDCRTDDARLVLETILAAVEAGAGALSHAPRAGVVEGGGGHLRARGGRPPRGGATTPRGRARRQSSGAGGGPGRGPPSRG